VRRCDLGRRKTLLISTDRIGTHSEKAIKTTRTAIRKEGILTQLQNYNLSYASISIVATVLTAKYSQISQKFSRPHNHQLITNALVTTNISNANVS